MSLTNWSAKMSPHEGFDIESARTGQDSGAQQRSGTPPFHRPGGEIMAVSQRHTKRLLAAYRRDGPAALAHGNRGRRPHNAIPEAAAAAVVKLASNHYAGANHTHLTELLREREGIDLSRPTVRRILARPAWAVPAVADPHNTGSGVGVCPRRAYWCRSTAATIPG